VRITLAQPVLFVREWTLYAAGAYVKAKDDQEKRPVEVPERARTEGRKGYSQEADSRGTVGGRAEGRQGPMGKEVLRLQALGEETNAVDDNCNRCTRRVRSVGKL